MVKNEKMSSFLKLVEKNYNKKTRKSIELQLKKDDEEIVDAYPVREVEHNWFSANTPAKEITRRLLNGYNLELKDKNGKIRTVGFDTYMYEKILKR